MKIQVGVSGFGGESASLEINSNDLIERVCFACYIFYVGGLWGAHITAQPSSLPNPTCPNLSLPIKHSDVIFW
jgi:hypothetical protein